ncbi:MAG TPA: response regulator [Spirochaetota bacterium]|nr:response regulator [Spirochaetota bacterium]
MSTILAVDDKQDNLVTITAVLRNLMPEERVITALSGEEGIALAVRESPDVIILDVKMPGLDGFETCARLKALPETAHVPVILLTAIRTDVESRVHGLEIGADAFLTKPIDEAELVAQIRVMLRIKRAEDRLRRERDRLESTVQQKTSELRRERDFLRTLEESSPAFFVAIGVDGTVLTMNRALLDALGCALDEAAGKPYLETFVPAREHAMLAGVFEDLARGGPGTTNENHIIARSGEERLVEWHGRAILSADGTVDYFFGVGIDITEKTKLEKRVLGEIEKERARIGQDLHDGLGQHLAGIAFKSEIVKLKLAERAPDAAGDIAEIGELVQQAIDQARGLARGLCPVDMDGGGLRAALADLCANTERLFPVACLLTWDEGIDVAGDLEATHLFYIVKEAVNNAFRHGAAKNIVITARRENDSVTVRVSDDGSGIPDEATGRGMGLSIMHYRAWVIGGSLSVQRNTSGGTDVAVSFLGAGAARREDFAEYYRGRFRADREKHWVLIVDDHPIVRQGLLQIINREPDLVVCGEARGADEALRFVSNTLPDIAVVDISLEGSSGIDLTRALRERYPELPVLVLSIHDEAIYAERALRAGARGYVMKQEAPGRVVGAIRTVLEGRQYLSEAMKETIMRKVSPDAAAPGASPEETLSDRELEVFQLIGQGLANRAIADRLRVSIKTVENLRERIKTKLGIATSSELVPFAIQWTLAKNK